MSVLSLSLVIFLFSHITNSNGQFQESEEEESQETPSSQRFLNPNDLPNQKLWLTPSRLPPGMGNWDRPSNKPKRKDRRPQNPNSGPNWNGIPVGNPNGGEDRPIWGAENFGNRPQNRPTRPTTQRPFTPGNGAQFPPFIFSNEGNNRPNIGTIQSSRPTSRPESTSRRPASTSRRPASTSTRPSNTSTRPSSSTTPEPTTTTLSPCEMACPVTGEFNPICSSEGTTYSNMGRLKCAQGCGKRVELNYFGNCRLARATVIPPLMSNLPNRFFTRI